MDKGKILAVLNELEAKYPVDQWVIGGIHVWPLIKIRVYYEIVNNAKKPAAPLSPRQHIKDFAVQLKYDLAYWKAKAAFAQKTGQQYDVVFHAAPTHRTNFNGIWVNRFCDGFIDYLHEKNYKALLLETAAFLKQYHPVNYNEAHRQETFLFRRQFLKQHQVAQVAPSASDFPDRYDAFCQDLEQAFGKGVADIFRKPRLIPYMGKLKVLVDFYKGILERTSPKMCFVVCFFDLDAMAFTVACHQLGIPCVELQHGIQGTFSVAYGNWKKLPEKGFELLPDIFWNWSNADAAVINNWSKTSQKHSAVAGGNPWLDYYDTFQALNPLNAEDAKILERPSPETRHILFTLQPASHHPFPEWLVKAVADSPENVKWWIRLHPRRIEQENEIRENLKKMADPQKYEIDGCSRVPLPLMLKHSDLHVTFSSATVKEAAAFGIKSVILDKATEAFFTDELKSGFANPYYGNSPEELNGFIQELLAGKAGTGNNPEEAPAGCTVVLEELLKSHVRR